MKNSKQKVWLNNVIIIVHRSWLIYDPVNMASVPQCMNVCFFVDSLTNAVVLSGTEKLCVFDPIPQLPWHLSVCRCPSFLGKIMSNIYQSPAIKLCPVPGFTPTWRCHPAEPAWPRGQACLFASPKGWHSARRWKGHGCPWPDLSPLLLFNARALGLWWLESTHFIHSWVKHTEFSTGT